MQNYFVPVLLLATACVTTQAAKPPEQATPSPVVSDAPGFVPERDWRGVVAEVVAVRGLAEKVPLQATFHDEASFLARLRKETGKLREPAVASRLRAEWLAFNLAPPSQDPVELLSAAYDDQVAAFYAPDEKRLHLRRQYPAALEKQLGPEGPRLVLAHEIQHGLQHQHFGLHDPTSFEDAALAHASVIEGEAMVVMMLVGTGGKVPASQVIAGAGAMGRLPTEQLLGMAGLPPAIANGPAAVREMLLMPYTAGMSAVASAHQLGGWKAVDTLLRKPPATTEQLLHFDAYVAGEQPLAVLDPPVPPGFSEVSRGSNGEEGLRLVFGACTVPNAAAALAKGWGGDRYVVARQGDRIALAWTIAFDDEPSATMATGFFRTTGCWTAGAGPWGRIATAGAQVTRNGRLVAVVRGLDDEAGRAHSRLLAQHPPIQAVPPVPPFDAETSAARVLQTSVVKGSTWTSPWMGLAATAPPGFVVTPDDAEQMVQVSAESPPSMGALQLVPESFGAESVRAAYDAMKASIAGAAGSTARLTDLPVKSVDLGWGRAERRSFVVSDRGRDTTMQVYAVPWCDARAWVMVTTMSSDPASAAALDGFVASVRREGTPHACTVRD